MSNIWATRLTNKPVMVDQTGEDWMAQHVTGAAVATSALEARMNTEAPVMQDDFWPATGDWLCYYRPYIVKGGTLFIPIKGLLVHDYGYAVGDWLTGYTYIAKAFERGMTDPGVDRIAMVISSGGGEVAGNFDLVDKIYSLRGQKPIQAFVNEATYSAAYSLASAADKISMTRTAGAGSIGVVMAHFDVSAAMDKAGVKVTFIHAGEHKVDGNPYSALSADVKKRMQARIDEMYDVFVSTVARNRDLPEQAVRDTEARTYGAAEALSLGLADSVLPFDEAVAAFSGALEDNLGEEPMPDPNQNEQAAQATQAQLDAARAEGRTEGASAERTRIQGILSAEVATNRREVALHLALNTNQSVEDATALLAITPESAPAASTTEPATNAFAAAMDASKNPNIRAGTEQAEATEQEKADANHAEFLQVMGLKGDK